MSYVTSTQIREEELEAIERHCALDLDVSPMVGSALVTEIYRLHEEISAYQVGDGYERGRHHAEQTYQRLLERERAETERVRGVLQQLEEWDLLLLDSEGKGVVLIDAAWARKIIAYGLQRMTV